LSRRAIQMPRRTSRSDRVGVSGEMACSGASRRLPSPPMAPVTDLEDLVRRWVAGSGNGAQPAADQSSFSLGSQAGLVRKENQDRVAHARFYFGGEPASLSIVCDGIGGMADGARCADLAIGAFLCSVVASSPARGPEALLAHAAFVANSRVFDLVGGRGGTTLASVLCWAGQEFACHVGDSRVYATAPDGTLPQVGVDDTFQARLQAMAAPAAHQPLDSERLVQYVGMGSDMEPHVKKIEVPADGRILLTSDGVHGPAGSVLPTLVRHASTPRRLVERVLALTLWLGGLDNATALCIFRASTGGEAEAGIRDQLLCEVWSPAGRLVVPLLGRDSLTQTKRAVPMPEPRRSSDPHTHGRRSKGKPRGGTRERAKAPPQTPPASQLSIEVVVGDTPQTAASSSPPSVQDTTRDSASNPHSTSGDADSAKPHGK